jgi:hypothetical protein
MRQGQGLGVADFVCRRYKKQDAAWKAALRKSRGGFRVSSPQKQDAGWKAALRNGGGAAGSIADVSEKLGELLRIVNRREASATHADKGLRFLGM